MKYGISKVAFSNEGSTITHLMIHEIVNQTVYAPTQETKQRVIDLIESANECWTILSNNSGNWDLGAQVHVVTTYHGKYLRTDKNNVSRDNLGNMPRFIPKVTSYSY